MAELLVRAKNKPGRGGKGDVIVICPDGHPWSERERTNPDWRIIKCADLPKPLDINDPLAELIYGQEGLAMRDQVKLHKPKRDKVFEKRGKRLNLPNLPRVARSRNTHDLEMSAGDLLLAMQGKP